MIPLLLLLAAAISLAALARRSFAETLPLTVLAAVLVTYLCTGAGYKNLALPLVGVAALTLVLLAGIKSAKEGGALRWRALAGRAGRISGGCSGPHFFLCGPYAADQFRRCGSLGPLHPPAVRAGTFQMCWKAPRILPITRRVCSCWQCFLQIGAPFRRAMLFTAQFLWAAALALPLLKEAQWKNRWWKNARNGWWAAACCFLACPPGLQNFIHIRSLPRRFMGPAAGVCAGHGLAGARPRLLDAAGVTHGPSLLMIAKVPALCTRCLDWLRCFFYGQNRCGRRCTGRSQRSQHWWRWPHPLRFGAAGGCCVRSNIPVLILPGCARCVQRRKFESFSALDPGCAR